MRVHLSFMHHVTASQHSYVNAIAYFVTLPSVGTTVQLAVRTPETAAYYAVLMPCRSP